MPAVRAAACTTADGGTLVPELPPPGPPLGARTATGGRTGGAGHDYLIPSIGDVPEIVSTAVPSYEPRGPYGAKEVGEGSMVPVLGSIANAIYDAIGVRMTELPITPERVLKALAEKRGEG